VNFAGFSSTALGVSSVSTAPHCSPRRHIRQRLRRLFSSATVFLLFIRFVMQLCLCCLNEPDTATRAAEHKCGRACRTTVIGLAVALGRRARSAAALAGAGARRVRAVSSVSRGAAATSRHQCRQWHHRWLPTPPGSSGMAGKSPGCGMSCECCGWTAPSAATVSLPPLGPESPRSGHCPCA